MTFCFYLLDTFWQNFSEIDSPGGGGVAAVVSEMRRLEKSEHTKFLVSLQSHENAEGGINLFQERCFQA